MYVSNVLVYVMYCCCYWLLLTVPTLVSIAGQDGSNQYQSVNQAVGNATGSGQKQWDDDGEDSPSPNSGVSACCVLSYTCFHCLKWFVYCSESK